MAEVGTSCNSCHSNIIAVRSERLDEAAGRRRYLQEDFVERKKRGKWVEGGEGERDGWGERGKGSEVGAVKKEGKG